MKKLLLIQITILISAFSFAKIEVLDRVAIIVDEGVVMESQIKDLTSNYKIKIHRTRYAASSYRSSA